MRRNGRRRKRPIAASPADALEEFVRPSSVAKDMLFDKGEGQGWVGKRKRKRRVAKGKGRGKRSYCSSRFDRDKLVGNWAAWRVARWDGPRGVDPRVGNLRSGIMGIMG